MSGGSPAQFVAAVELRTLFEAASWPALSSNPDGVEVLFGDLGGAPGKERVVVVGEVVDDDEQHVTMGRSSKEQTFTVMVEVYTAVAGRTALEAFERCGELVAHLDTLIRDPTTGVPVIPAAARAAGIYRWTIAGVRTAPVLPVAGDGTEGYVAAAEVRVAVKAHI